ncbi:hypothetical protein G6F65_018082 [Rhizopus arrhizus]|nr:hypothetical protein G6F65_018082 [Rhizopus arrhizus]
MDFIVRKSTVTIVSVADKRNWPSGPSKRTSALNDAPPIRCTSSVWRRRSCQRLGALKSHVTDAIGVPMWRSTCSAWNGSPMPLSNHSSTKSLIISK